MGKSYFYFLKVDFVLKSGISIFSVFKDGRMDGWMDIMITSQ